MCCFTFSHRHTCTADGDSPSPNGNTSSNRYLHPTDTDINADRTSHTDRYAHTANSHPYPTDANSPASHRHSVRLWLRLCYHPGCY
jgi:hypothetical protein